MEQVNKIGEPTKQIRVFTKKFECLKDVLSDSVCREKIISQIKDLKFKRIAGPPAGMKFKRSGYDTLSESGHLNVDYFVKAYPEIEAKKSPLPSTQRSLINEIVVNAIRRTIEAHSVIVERGFTFRIKDSEELEVGYVVSFNPTENTINIRQRIGRKSNEVVWKFDETMERIEKGELIKC